MKQLKKLIMFLDIEFYVNIMAEYVNLADVFQILI